MGLNCYLAMTATEFSKADPLPPSVAWMACHFSCYGLGLSNLPPKLPTGSLVILNDRTPISGHDPVLIRRQLESLGQIGGILLDLQRKNDRETASLVKELTAAPPWPVAVTEWYAGDIDCPVFLSAPPLHKSLAAHIAPWEGREIWLEAATELQTVTVTQQGSTFKTGPVQSVQEPAFEEETLHMRYHLAVTQQAAVFTMVREISHVKALLAEAEELGITKAVGLYQQLRAL